MQTLRLSIFLFIFICSGICFADILQDEVSEPNYLEADALNSVDETEVISYFQFNGFLVEQGVPVYGHYDLEFTLYDTPNDVNLVASPIIIKDVNVIDGHYSVELDFGAGLFGSQTRWLEIWKKSAGSEDSYEMSGQREKLSPVPYSLYAHDSNSLTVGNDEIISRNSLDAADGNPTNAVYVNDYGFVGINTTSPLANLDIAGYLKTDGFVMSTGASNGYVLTSNSIGEGAWKPLASTFSGFTGTGVTGYLSKFTSSNTLGLSSLFDNDGKIGIGTSSPNAKLEVQGGPIKATGGLIIETRTSDPSNPVTGQIWLRTDF